MSSSPKHTVQSPWHPLHPASSGLFLLLVAAWVVVRLISFPDSPAVRISTRLCGYGAAVALAVPYIHIVRRWFRYRYEGGYVRTWLAWHIAASYLAFFLVLFHCKGQANGALALVILVLLWIVMVSGAVGYYGQKLLYYLLPLLIEREYGRERLGPQRELLLEHVKKLSAKSEIAKAPDMVRKFAQVALEQCFEKPFTFWRLLGARTLPSALMENHYLGVLEMADAKQGEAVRQLWQFVLDRRQLDREYRLHYLGRLWLLFHGPAAAALLVLVVDHIVMSVYYGGY